MVYVDGKPIVVRTGIKQPSRLSTEDLPDIAGTDKNAVVSNHKSEYSIAADHSPVPTISLPHACIYCSRCGPRDFEPNIATPCFQACPRCGQKVPWKHQSSPGYLRRHTSSQAAPSLHLACHTEAHPALTVALSTLPLDTLCPRTTPGPDKGVSSPQLICEMVIQVSSSIVADGRSVCQRMG